MASSSPLSRRLLLRSAALTSAGAALSGCASRSGRSTTGTGDRVRPRRAAGIAAAASEPDVRLVRAAIADEHAVLQVSLANGAGDPSLRKALAPVVDQQRAHIAALRAALTSPPHAPTTSHHPVQGSREDALRRVRSALVDVQRRRRDDALTAGSGPLARLFASMSASHAVASGLDELRP